VGEFQTVDGSENDEAVAEVGTVLKGEATEKEKTEPLLKSEAKLPAPAVVPKKRLPVWDDAGADQLGLDEEDEEEALAEE
jgi:hypothetical protein